MTYTFRKSDVLSSIIIGEIAAVFLILTLRNLREVPILDIIIRAKLLVLIFVPALVTLGVYLTFLLGKSRPFFFQFGKFITIGASNTTIDFGVLNLLMFVTGVETGYMYSIFKAVSFIAAVINSYVWNRFWTFENPETRGTGSQFFWFIVISLGGFGINVAVASFVVNVIEPVGGVSGKVWANVGALIGVMFLVVWNFFGYKFMVFKK